MVDRVFLVYRHHADAADSHATGHHDGARAAGDDDGSRPARVRQNLASNRRHPAAEPELHRNQVQRADSRRGLRLQGHGDVRWGGLYKLNSV
jgi:hypothetical protein